jgi:hypothetical protein
VSLEPWDSMARRSLFGRRPVGRHLPQRISDVKFSEVDVRGALAEATTLKRIVALEARELADIVF